MTLTEQQLKDFDNALDKRLKDLGVESYDSTRSGKLWYVSFHALTHEYKVTIELDNRKYQGKPFDVEIFALYNGEVVGYSDHEQFATFYNVLEYIIFYAQGIEEHMAQHERIREQGYPKLTEFKGLVVQHFDIDEHMWLEGMWSFTLFREETEYYCRVEEQPSDDNSDSNLVLQFLTAPRLSAFGELPPLQDAVRCVTAKECFHALSVFVAKSDKYKYSPLPPVQTD